MTALTKANAKSHSFRPKVYDGSRVVIHPVTAGETLARIAANYQMKSWQPLWRYNSQVHAILTGTPDDLKPGVSIMIPRSQKGYVDLLKNLSSVRAEAEGAGDRLKYEIESQQNLLKADKEILDFVYDVATTVITLGAKAAISSKAAKAAKVATGQAKIAQRLSANAITKEFAEQFAKARIQRVSKALAHNAKARAFRPNYVAELRDQAIGATAAYADRVAGKQIKDDEFEWFSKAVKGVMTGMDAREAWKVVGAGGKLLDFAGIALDYIKPSHVAEIVLLASTGETAEGSQANTLDLIAKSTARSLDHLDNVIAKYRDEIKLLYG